MVCQMSGSVFFYPWLSYFRTLFWLSMIMMETKKNSIKHNHKDILKLLVSSNKSNICYMLRFYLDILLINNDNLTSLSCNMQPRRSDTYAATTLSSMCSPAFCRAAQKKMLTSQNKSLMQWKQ